MNGIITFFEQGGVFMYPIAIVLLFGIGITIERWLVLTASKTSNKKIFNRIIPLLKKKDYSAVVDVARKTKAPVGRIVAAGLARMQHSSRRDDVEYAMEEGVLEAVPKLEKRTQYIATLANIATLLGLLGTIMGLIDAFTAVASADPSENAAMLSASISTAMNTTAFGLMSAIPLLLFHAALQNKTNEIVDSLEMAGVKSLNTIANNGAFNSHTRATDAL